jgi:hypothetical protein
MSTPINIPLGGLVPTVPLNAYGPKRTFVFVPGATSPGQSRVKVWGSADGVNFPPTTATPLLELSGESQPKTIEDLSLAYRALPSGPAGVSLTVDVQLDCCDNGGNFLQTTTIPNRPTGGQIGGAPSTVDVYEAFLVDQTTAGQTLTLPAPTDPAATRRAYIENVGSAFFEMYGQRIIPGSWLELLWNGTTWAPGPGVSDGVNGIEIGGGANAYVEIDVAGSGGFQLNAGGAAPIEINGGGTVIVRAAVALTTEINGGGSQQLGINATDHSTTIGSVTGASPLALRAGTGGLTIVNNGNTWLWPTADGAAGTKLTTNGAGVLSFT